MGSNHMEVARGIFWRQTRRLMLAWLVLACAGALAQRVPPHAEGLTESLVTVPVREGVTQSGLLSLRTGGAAPTILALLLPGHPSVVRPVVQDGVMVDSQLTGNFLIRARRHLADEAIATLVADCLSDSGDTCASTYQASADRQQHVQLLVDLVLQLQPSLKTVWLVGTSMGTISSSFMARYGGRAYAGAIHTASITEPFGPKSYRELADFDYGKTEIPQLFVHHKEDPCTLTTYAGAQQISARYRLPLVSVTGGSGFTGGPCQAHTQHGFKNREREVMRHIAEAIKTGKLVSAEL